MLVIPVNRVVDPKRIIGKKCKAEEEERNKGSLPPNPIISQNRGPSRRRKGTRGC
jgi:hypothetical protein